MFVQVEDSEWVDSQFQNLTAGQVFKDTNNNVYLFSDQGAINLEYGTLNSGFTPTSSVKIDPNAVCVISRP